MKIAVLSGKGGTGKTFISVNLATIMKNGLYIDCDVEEPNGHLFLKPNWTKKQEIYRKVPLVDDEKCVGCRTCSEFCRFNALAYINGQIKVFEQICHACGGCVHFCPTNAISEVDKAIGEIRFGESEGTKVLSGMMMIKEASGVPIIHQLIEKSHAFEQVVIDCPPGSACTVMESIKDADYCVLVAEPSIFSRHNLEMVHELVQLYNIPYGVVLNKTIGEENPSKAYCADNHIPILGEIEYHQELANILSVGKVASRESIVYKHIFNNLLEKIVKEVENETTSNH